MLFVGPRARTVRCLWTALLFITALAPSPATAQGRSARDYLNAPIDSWLTIANSNYSSSVTPEDGTDISSPVRTNVFSQTFILTRTMNFWGRTGGISAILPFVDANATTAGTRLSNNGASDLGLMWQMNIFGGPALTREQFRSFVPKTFSSVHLIMLVPTGKYDPSNAINPSSNRWTFYPTVNYSYTPDKGWTWIELYLSTKIFSSNRNFGPGGTLKLTQKPLYLGELHASRNLIPRLWVSGDAYYTNGAETSLDGYPQSNAANTLRLGVGSGIRAWTGGMIIFNFEQVVAKPSGQPDSHTFRLKIQQLW
jgi:Putative MetA-pathway of phenol degradation